ncbi:ribbon-helix-helix domain-containing protein [Desulfonatronum sp. SC1]|uniref:ribbon-helix-helix domain-containing protein n=1 Tax=Desulfonatronum sp. SC1 TaxID=2109626 RepID=UPI000D311AC6|nr:ribbon-helix-helix domain-containing protein [Desulfonatronum sp. SC1]PTN33480.1 intracellular proteinase I [Desulfonatronum sp. SC1]
MCQLFINADSDLWKSQTKSLRIDGVSTSIRIENFFWTTLEEIATRDRMTVNQLITKLYFESMDADHDLGNFTSFLRVCCARYHALMAAGELSPALNEELCNVPSAAILERESARWTERGKLVKAASPRSRMH